MTCFCPAERNSVTPFVMWMIMMLIIMDVDNRGTRGSPWIPSVVWCVNVDWLQHCPCLSKTRIIKTCLWDVLRGIAIYSSGGFSSPPRKHSKFYVLTCKHWLQLKTQYLKKKKRISSCIGETIRNRLWWSRSWWNQQYSLVSTMTFIGHCLRFRFLFCVLLEENVEVDAWVKKLSERMGFKPYELDTLEEGYPRDFFDVYFDFK